MTAGGTGNEMRLATYGVNAGSIIVGSPSTNLRTLRIGQDTAGNTRLFFTQGTSNIGVNVFNLTSLPTLATQTATTLLPGFSAFQAPATNAP